MAMYKPIMDLEASNYITSCRMAFDTYEVIASHNIYIYLNDDNVMKTIGIDSIVIKVMVKDQIKIIRIKNIFLVLKLQANLLLVSKLLSTRLKIQFNLNECIVRGPDGEVISIGLHNGNLYKMNFKNVHIVDAVDLVQSWRKDNAFQFWNCWLGHLNAKCVRILKNIMSGMNLSKILCTTSSSIREHAMRDNNLGRYFPMIGDSKQKKCSTFGRGWPHERCVHRC